MLMPDHPEMHLPTDLLGVTPARFDARREDGRWEAALGPACNRIRKAIMNISVLPRRQSPAGTSRVSREEFAQHLLKALGNPKVENVRCITYTGEVDQGLINEFHVKGPKRIEFYKRSPLSDLAEEQTWNLRRLSVGTHTRQWRKRRISITVCQRLAEVAPILKRRGVTLLQYLYDAPPSRRAYIFDEQAVVAYYQVVDALEEEGSVYQGMTNAPAIVVDRGDPQWEYVQDELNHLMAGLRRVSRSWDEEKAILLEGGPWTGHGRRPCVRPTAALFDVDGVLLDSLSFHARAWSAGFAEIGLDFPETLVYAEEGRRGRETVINRLVELGVNPTDELVGKILHKRKTVLTDLGLPPVMNGAQELIQNARNAGLAIWAVTGSSDPTLRTRLLQAFEGLIDKSQMITGEDTFAGKPAAEPYALACARAGIHAHNAIAVENSPLGVRSADQAGTFCIAVNSGPLPATVLERAGARAVFTSCEALAASWGHVMSLLTDYSEAPEAITV
jgi:HAD superfamily hydrolase (TIGR01509 family)